MNDVWSGIIWSLAPTVLVGLIFWVVMRAVIRADRTERKVYAKMEAEERAKRGLPQKSLGSATLAAGARVAGRRR